MYIHILFPPKRSILCVLHRALGTGPHAFGGGALHCADMLGQRARQQPLRTVCSAKFNTGITANVYS